MTINNTTIKSSLLSKLSHGFYHPKFTSLTLNVDDKSWFTCSDRLIIEAGALESVPCILNLIDCFHVSAGFSEVFDKLLSTNMSKT